jgi:ureidoglycolate lyase/2,4-diketo-3-deoxy-L-fuconate hydrolase
MKLARFGNRGQEKPALLDADENLRDLSALINDIDGAVLAQRMSELAAVDPASLPLVTGNPRIAQPVAHVGKFICVGLNYADHAAESGMEKPKEPILFFKATSAITGPNDDILLPRGYSKADWEVELGIVIGQETRYVSEAEAGDHIAGYCVVNDLSERAFQLERAGQWVKGKSCDSFGPIGPWLVTADSAGDIDNLGIWLEIDGERVQDSNTNQMIFNLHYLVHYISQFMSLQPGDVISTGTPRGVGMGFKPPRWLKPGHSIRLGIDGLGIQQQRVCAPSAAGVASGSSASNS